jgi:hypothetical protein
MTLHQLNHPTIVEGDDNEFGEVRKGATVAYFKALFQLYILIFWVITQSSLVVC